MSQTNQTTTTTGPRPALGLSNILTSPGSTWAGAAGILGVLSSAMQNGLPTSPAGWITFAVSLLTGIGALLSRA